MNVYLNKAKNQLKGAWVLMPVQLWTMQLQLFFCPPPLTEKIEKMNNRTRRVLPFAHSRPCFFSDGF